MENIQSSIDLRTAIILLEAKQAEERKALNEQFRQAYENVQPANLIKSALHNLSASPEIKDQLFTSTVGLAAGYISKKAFEGVTHGPLRKLLGTALMFSITKAVTHNPEAVKAIAKGIFKMLTHKPTSHTHPNETQGQGHDAYANDKMKFEFPVKGFTADPS